MSWLFYMFADFVAVWGIAILAGCLVLRQV
jgi:hypothetical protein